MAAIRADNLPPVDDQDRVAREHGCAVENDLATLRRHLAIPAVSE